MIVLSDYNLATNSGKEMHQQSPVLVKVSPVAAWTIDVTAVSVRTITEEWALGCRSWIDDFDLQ